MDINVLKKQLDELRVEKVILQKELCGYLVGALERFRIKTGVNVKSIDVSFIEEKQLGKAPQPYLAGVRVGLEDI